MFFNCTEALLTIRTCTYGIAWFIFGYSCNKNYQFSFGWFLESLYLKYTLLFSCVRCSEQLRI
uniref:Uncharacterized protein n=1 Tax=Rhizophora mucronata TaxID=61149 RepID=A0A2P2P941_RHIMU